MPARVAEWMSKVPSEPFEKWVRTTRCIVDADLLHLAGQRMLALLDGGLGHGGQGLEGPAALRDNLVQSRAWASLSDRPLTRSTRSNARHNHTGFDHRRASRAPRRCSRDSLKGQGVLVLAAIFAAYIVLGILYESFIHPITIISGLPSAGVGALLVLILFQMDLSVIAMIGIVMLVGIVKKNAIMIIDFAIERRRLRSRRRTRDPRSLRSAFSSDHDDDFRRDLRNAADCARYRCGRRTAPAARHCRDWRSAACRSC